MMQDAGEDRGDNLESGIAEVEACSVVLGI